MHPIFEIFDSYSRQARLFPALLTIFPPLLMALAWFPELITSSIGASLLTLCTSCGLLYALASFSRSRGKEVEKRLLKEWGGWPTTLLLRQTSKLDPITRSRYLKFLGENVPDLRLSSALEESTDQFSADNQYSSAIKWLKEKTRSEKFALIERENAQYGYRRNLRGLKSIGLSCCGFAIMATLATVYSKRPDILSMFKDISAFEVFRQFSTLDDIVIAGILTNLIAIFAWLFVVEDSWVEEAGFQYGEALLASCDKIAQSAVTK